MKVTFSDDYNLLLKQAKSLLCLVNSTEKQVHYLHHKDYQLAERRLNELEKSLESEKEMNAILTGELEELKRG